MKKVKAWLLLALLLSHWIGCLLCFEIKYYVEIQHDMNALEQVIAAEVTQTTGVESSIRIEDTAIPRGNIYSDFFLFSKEMDNGKIVYYTIENNAESFDIQQITHCNNSPISDAEKVMLFKSLFQEFVMPQPISNSASTRTFDQVCFRINECKPQSYLLVTTPPPDARV